MEPTEKRPLILSTAPHVFDGITTQKVMLNVLIALAPTLVASFVIFGWQALLVTAVTTLACVLFEYLWCRLRKTPQTVGDLSAVVTGLLLAFNLPSTIPLYMAVIGSFVAIVVVKELFGGIGRNFANPAIVARIVLSVSFTAAMTNYAAPQGFLPGAAAVDAVSSATPLAPGAAQLPFMDLLFGVHPGVLGETCGAAILLGLIWLLATRTITFTIPGVYVGTVIVLSLLTGHDVSTQVFSGGLLLGAVFMATDYVGSPTSFKGQLIFGVGLGLITCLIRFWGNMDEGVAYSILLMNLVVPYIDSLTATTPLGGAKKRRFARARKEGGER
ncbi:RnfABCDGE type electron transport complex subunit D [Eggerthella sp. NSJ-70]|uniref:Ion-translocating oxidoreductase complex subunit D n=1 Tax=Eggerthella hominis TaxID=2763043 RepID=A0ABR7BWF0_9ACTN|nr:RnfABCDGE type electron transport complex subunit D [Eggerthella hominis]MBC5585884.1 RnfABCDGE type electron transport complex subunit D [Eggerthella hominis]